jgi:DNA-binding MarR family transcriptional regulator
VSRQRPFAQVHVVDDERLGAEARAQASDHSAVRLWLRLLACSTQVEQTIRTRLRERFGISLSRFDYLAQLERHPGGLRLNALSRNLMVTGGNVTLLTEQLVADGWITRATDTADRRSTIVSLTPWGRREFLRMAAEHEQWLVELFRGFDGAHRDALYEQLGRLRAHLTPRGSSPSSRQERAS